VPTLRLADYLQEDLVLWDIPGSDKPAFMQALASGVAARLPALDERDLLARIMAREAEQSTGVGGGLALPHAMLPGLERTVLAVGRARQALDFGAIDAKPVDLVFLLLGPAGASTEHLRLLARVARIFSSEETLETLRTATTPTELFRLLLQEDSRRVY
jgi:PTS system nitrogen regulatory IIA component